MANNSNPVSQIGVNNAGSTPSGANTVSSRDPRSARSWLGMAALMIAAVAAGGAVLEGILTLSIPLSEQAREATEMAMVPPQPLAQTSRAEAEPKPEASPSQPTHASCNTHYFAVFKTDKGSACARNPTLIMAHWGPPTAEWFRTRDGSFEVTPADLAPQALCTCLAAGAAYSAQTGRSVIEPIRRLSYGGQDIGIEKWVCADECRIQTAEIEHEP